MVGAGETEVSGVEEVVNAEDVLSGGGVEVGAMSVVLVVLVPGSVEDALSVAGGGISVGDALSVIEESVGDAVSEGGGGVDESVGVAVAESVAESVKEGEESESD